MNRFNRPRLINFEDPAYQRHVAEMKLQRANQRAIRPPTQRDLFGGESEAIIRDAIGAHIAQSDRRIVEYEERKGRNWQRKFRELDGVAVDGNARIHVFEIKASRRTGALHRALRQLRETRAILQLAFRSVSLAVIVVDTGMLTAAERDALAAEPDAPERLPQTLDEAIADYPDVRRVATLADLSAYPADIELVVLTLDELVALAGDRQLSLDWEADELDEAADDPPAPKPAGPLYSSGGAEPEAEDESPFAAALRRASGGKGR